MFFINLGLVETSINGNFWTDLEHWFPNTTWNLNFAVGVQQTSVVWNTGYAWAVRDGDVVTVPTPNTFWLFAIGLALNFRALRLCKFGRAEGYTPSRLLQE